LVTTVCPVAVLLLGTGSWVMLSRLHDVDDAPCAGWAVTLTAMRWVPALLVDAIVTSAQVTVPHLVFEAGPVQLPLSVEMRANWVTWSGEPA
jgi:hypothetical protein